MIPKHLKRMYALGITIGIAALLLALSLTVPILSTTTDFSIYNTGWNGTSDLAVATYKTGNFVPALEVRNTGVDIEPVVVSLGRIPLDPETSSIVIIGPSEDFSTADGDYVSDFLAGGGLVVIADDFGTGNTLLSKLDTTSRFSEKLAIDLAFEKKPEFVVAYNFDDSDPLTNDVSMLLLNYPSTIIPSANATVLGTTSVGSWFDDDGDEFKDADEAGGPFPIITVESIGKGTLVLVSDPSTLINSMADQLDNQVFVDNLLAYVSSGRTSVLIDESHRKYFDPISFSVMAVGGLSDGAKLMLVVTIVVAFFLATTDIVSRTTRFVVGISKKVWRRIRRMFSKEERPQEPTLMSDEELLETVMARNPGWNRAALVGLLRMVRRHGGVSK